MTKINLVEKNNVKIEKLQKDLIDKFPDSFSRIFLNEPMSCHSTFKVGGQADCFFSVTNTKEIFYAIKKACYYGLNTTILGNGSNILVADKGIRGLVISIGKDMAKISLEEDTQIVAEAGALLSTVSKFAASHNLTGLEFALGIPGTVGGAVFMNAGAYDGCIANILVESEGFNLKEEKLFKLQGILDHDFSYRNSFYSQSGSVILKTRFKLEYGDKEQITLKMKDYTQRRKNSQPLTMPSAGSTFKRPEGHYAGKLIEDSNLKGFKIGGASVSQKHAGFIINEDNASAQDIYNLIEYVKKSVYEKQGILLEPEVKILGEW